MGTNLTSQKKEVVGWIFHQFFSTVGDKISKFLGFNPVLENIVVMKVAIVLIALSILISSSVLLVLAISHSRLKKTLKITFRPSTRFSTIFRRLTRPETFLS